MTRLMGLQFKIIYKKGKENVAADALSRVGHMMAIQAVSSVQPVWVQVVLNSYTTDSKAQHLRLAITSPDQQGYSLEKGLIWHHGKIWIGSNSALQTKIIAACHSNALGGHSSISYILKTQKALCLERDEVRCGEFCEAMHHLPTCQAFPSTPHGFTTTTTNSRRGVARPHNGFHRGATKIRRL